MADQRPFFLAQTDDKGHVTFEFPSQVTAYLRRKLPKSAIEVEFREQRDKRSLRQNAGLHSMLTPWAREEGHNIDELKRDLLREVFGTYERTNPITGEVVLALCEPHTSDLNVTQFSELIERSLDIAAGCGFVLVAPDEYRRQKEAERKRLERAAQKPARHTRAA